MSDICDLDDLDRLVRGELLGERAGAISAHAAGCPACGRELRWLKLEREVIGRGRPPSRVGDEQWADLERRLRESPAPRGAWRGRRGTRGNRRRMLIGGATCLALVATVVLAVMSTGGGGQPLEGAHRSATRDTLHLGDRGTLVAEPNSVLSWRIDAGDAQVEQRVGNVFYRVEPGGSFVVRTAFGEIVVAGTCFRVELEGAALAVTVYEGRVHVRNAAGELELAPGEVGRVVPGGAPYRVVPGSEPEASLLSPDQLLARDRAQRERIAALEARLKEQGADSSGTGRGGRKRAFEMSGDELLDLARQCDLPVDVPPTLDSSIMEKILDDAFADANYTAAEREVAERIVRGAQPDYEARMRALYQELTGSAEGESLDSTTMMMEIVQKSPPDDIAQARKLLAEERAGLRSPPASLEGRTIIERTFRLAIASADDLARSLAAELSTERVRAFRRGWGGVHLGPGCP